jgi:hypothetical protein
MHAAQIKPDGSIHVMTLNGLEEMQESVGGMIEMTGGNGWDAYVNENGLMMELAYNATATELLGHPIVGNAVFFGGYDDEGEDVDISDEQLQQLLVGQARTAVLKHFNSRRETK